MNYTFPCGCSWPILKPAENPDELPLLDFDDRKIPDSCPAVWDLFASGLTKGVFQLEKNLGRKWSKRLRPESIDDVAALVALLRPGCLLSEDERGVSMTENYCRRKNGEEPVESIHPAYDVITQNTYNIIVYQETIMRIGAELAGFNLVEVDELRKAVGKKDQKKLAKVKEKFLEGVEREKIISEQQAKRIWGWIEKSGRYAFNKSHAVSYGRESYDTAFIKAHFPFAFFAGWLRHAEDKSKPFEEIAELVEEMKVFNVSLLPPDIRTLRPYFFINHEKKTIQVGLAVIKGVGAKQVDKLQDVNENLTRLFSKTLEDCTWLEFLMFGSHYLTSTTVKRFIESGAMDHWGLQRKLMLRHYEIWSDLKNGEKKHACNLELYRRGLLDRESLVPMPDPDGMERKKYERKRERQLELVALAEERASLIKEDSFLSILYAVSPLKSAGGGASQSSRTSNILGEAHLLEHPPSPLVDSISWKAWTEEEWMGASITCERLDGCSLEGVNVSCADYLAGQTGHLVFGVQIKSARVVQTKKGRNPGSDMAFLTISDSTGYLTDVVVFSDDYKQFRDLLDPGNLVILEGQRDHRKNSDSLIVKHVTLAD